MSSVAPSQSVSQTTQSSIDASAKKKSGNLSLVNLFMEVSPNRKETIRVKCNVCKANVTINKTSLSTAIYHCKNHHSELWEFAEINGKLPVSDDLMHEGMATLPSAFQAAFQSKKFREILWQWIVDDEQSHLVK